MKVKLIVLVLMLAASMSMAQTQPTVDRLCIQTSLSATTTGTTKQVLGTCTIPAGVFVRDYVALEYVATFTGAANTNSKTAGATLAGTDINTLASTVSAEIWGLRMRCDIQAADTLTCIGSNTIKGGTTAANFFTQSLSYTFLNTYDLTFFATTGTAAGDATLRSYSVYLVRR